MATILKFPAQAPTKFGFKRVSPRRRKDDENQLDLFVPNEGKILRIPTGLSAFEEALSMEERGDEQAAIEMYGRAIIEGDSVADSHCNLGVLQSQRGESAAAFESFKNALKLDQQHWETHYNIGNLYFDTEDFRPARLHYELAAEVQPEFRNIFYNLGLVLAIQEEVHPAIEALSRYRELAPDGEAGAAADLLETLTKSLEG